MRFRMEQNYAADADAVAAAYAHPLLYESFADLPRAGKPEVVRHQPEGNLVHLDVRWRFTAPLSSAARAVIDPGRLTWVQRSVHDLAARKVTYEMVADHYADRFHCEGSYRFEATPEGTKRTSEGDLRIKAPLIARTVENAVIDGLKEQLAAEVPIVERFVKG